MCSEEHQRDASRVKYRVFQVWFLKHNNSQLMTQGTNSLTIFRLQLKFNGNSVMLLSSGWWFIATKLCTWHYSFAAIIWLPRREQPPKGLFHRNWITNEKSIVKWAAADPAIFWLPVYHLIMKMLNDRYSQGYIFVKKIWLMAFMEYCYF